MPAVSRLVERNATSGRASVVVACRSKLYWGVALLLAVSFTMPGTAAADTATENRGPSGPTADDTASPGGAAILDTADVTAASSTINRSSRTAVRDAYRNWYKQDIRTSIGWTGNVGSCSPGAPSASTHAATLSRVNYYRAMAGLGPVTFDPVLSERAQKAALMMQANSQLSHSPPSSWKCWSPDGATGAGESNIALGASGPAAIDLYMVDPGASNTAVGHRRWILYPIQRTMGSGSTASAHALSVLAFDRSWPRPTPQAPIAWPGAGYFPQELEPRGRWSLSIPGAGFANANVSVTGPNGAGVPVTVHRVRSGFGDNAITWQIPSAATPSTSDRTYRVTVSGITNSGSSTHTYEVTLFPADPPPNRPPFGRINTVTVDGKRITISGVAGDPDGTPRVRVTSTVSGRRSVRTVTAHGGRFTASWNDSAGTHRICVSVLDVPTNVATPIGCRDAVVK